MYLRNMLMPVYTRPWSQQPSSVIFKSHVSFFSFAFSARATFSIHAFEPAFEVKRAIFSAISQHIVNVEKVFSDPDKCNGQPFDSLKTRYITLRMTVLPCLLEVDMTICQLYSCWVFLQMRLLNTFSVNTDNRHLQPIQLWMIFFLSFCFSALSRRVSFLFSTASRRWIWPLLLFVGYKKRSVLQPYPAFVND